MSALRVGFVFGPEARRPLFIGKTALAALAANLLCSQTVSCDHFVWPSAAFAESKVWAPCRQGAGMIFLMIFL